MRTKLIYCLIGLMIAFSAQAQTDTAKIQLSPSLTKKLTIDSFCLCQTTISGLKTKYPDLRQTGVEEMDLTQKCIAGDSRFESGKGYETGAVEGMVFQIDTTLGSISKIRLTNHFQGILPDGNWIDLHQLTLRQLFYKYPNLKDTWGSRDCSDYWNFGNDTLSFYVKIDPKRLNRFPIDTAYYMDQPVCAADFKVSCTSIRARRKVHSSLKSDAVFFIDSLRATRADILKYQPTDIASVTVVTDSNAIKLLGPDGANGAVYIETKLFARQRYWKFLGSRSKEYMAVVPTPESDTSVAYFLNGKVLQENYQGKLSSIDEKRFVSLTVIGKDQLFSEYGVEGKLYGIIITAHIWQEGIKEQ